MKIINKPMNRLSQAKIKNTRKTTKLCDGGGLWIVIQKTQTGINRKWVLRYSLFNKNRSMGLGSYNDVSLAEAREKAAIYRKLVMNNIDPIEHRKSLQQQAHSQSKIRDVTFKTCTEEYIAAHASSWKREKYKFAWENTLKHYAYPVFKEIPVADIDTPLVLEALEPIWSTIHVTAKRVRQRIKKVLNYAQMKGYRDGSVNPAEWVDRLDQLLPSLANRKINHFPAMPFAEVPAFVALLSTQQSTSARALLLTIISALRTSEAIEGTGSEFNFEDNTWTIPSERMKVPKLHRVPLPHQAIPIIRQLLDSRIVNNEYIFPGLKRGRPIGTGAMHAYLKRYLGYKDITVHGFRSSFRDWASETTNYPEELGEACLAHVLKNKVQAAYQRGDLLERRRQLMQEWADFIFSEVKANTPTA